MLQQNFKKIILLFTFALVFFINLAAPLGVFAQDAISCETNRDCPLSQDCELPAGVCVDREFTPTEPTLPEGPEIKPDTGTGGTPPSGVGEVGTLKPNANWCGNDPNLVYQNGVCLPKDQACQGDSLACTDSLSGLILKVISYLLFFAGAIAVLFIIIGGFLYITAQGNEEQAEKGRKALTNAVIGVIIISLAYVIVRVVENTLSSNSVIK